MQYVSRTTGLPISEIEDVRQSIIDILTTPLGSRIKLRDYGSLIPRLVDRPVNATLPIEVYSAVAEALSTYENRFILTRVDLVEEDSSPEQGVVAMNLTGVYLPTGRQITFDRVNFLGEP